MNTKTRYRNEGEGHRGHGRLVEAAIVLVLILLIGSTIIVYNIDTIYLRDKPDLTLSLAMPDKVMENSELAFVLVVTDHRGNPLPKEHVEIILSTEDNQTLKLYEGTTTKDGMLTPSVQLPADYYGNATITVKHQKEVLTQDLLIVRDTIAPERDEYDADKVKILISTDKPLYQPGQIIHIRTLATYGLGEGVCVANPNIELIDPKGNIIFRKELSANEFGIANIDYPLSDILPLGTYRIKVTINESVAEKTILVKEYVLPKFKIEFEGLKNWYTVDETIEGTITCKYVFGKMVKGHLSLKAETYYGVMETVYEIDGELIDGRFEFSIPPVEYAVGLPYYKDNAILNLNVTVTDDSGHAETKLHGVTIARKPILVTMIGDTNVPGLISNYYVIAQYPDGTAVGDADVTYQFGKQVERTYNDEKYYITDFGDTYHTVTDMRGIAKLSFTYDAQTELKLTVTKGDSSVTEWFTLTATDAIKLVAERQYCKVGESVKFDVFYTGDSFTRWAYYDVVLESGFVTTSGALELDTGKGTFTLPITSDMVGTVIVRVFKLEQDSTVVRDDVMLIIAPASELNVRIEKAHECYTPGQDVELNFYVQHEHSNNGSCIAAIEIAIVDQSIFELAERYGGFEEIYLALEREFIDPQWQICEYVFGNGTTLPLAPTKIVHSPRVTTYYTPQVTAKSVSSWEKYQSVANNLKSIALNTYWSVVVVGTIILMFGLIVAGIRYKPAFAIFVLLILVLTVIIGGALWWSATRLSRVAQEGEEEEDMRMVTNATYPRAKEVEAGGPDDVLSKPVLMEQDIMLGAEAADVWETTDSDLGTATMIVAPSYLEVAGELHAAREQLVRTREYFPETWYWHPCIITDEHGVASISLTTPDTITTWEIKATASTQDAYIGVTTENLTVFQDFFIEPDIPESVIRNDTFQLRVMVYNYDNITRNISVFLEHADWFLLEQYDDASVDATIPFIQNVTLDAYSVGSVYFTIRALTVGTHNLTLSAFNGNVWDRVVRELRVDPDGKCQSQRVNGELTNNATATVTIALAPERIPGSELAYVKLQGGMEAVLIDGAEQYIHFVSGCGEQSTSRLSVDIAAYKALLRSHSVTPEKMFEYENIITQGIQHELIYLIDDPDGYGRAICWHVGEPPDIWLTAWALFAFQDLLDTGFEVDRQIITDMQTYLLSEQRADGSFEFPDIGHWSINSELLNQKVASTAYIVRALLYSNYPADDPSIHRALQYIEAQINMNDSAFTLALALCALEAAAHIYSDNHNLRDAIAEKLAAIRLDGDDDTVYWAWSVPGTTTTTTTTMTTRRWSYMENDIETTAYAIIALHMHGGYMSIVRQAVKYLLTHRLGGCFGSTHDTAVAFQALSIIGEIDLKSMDVEILVDDMSCASIHLGPENKDITFYIDLRPYLQEPETTVKLVSQGEGTILYEVYYEEYVYWHDVSVQTAPELELRVTYNTTTIAVNDCIRADVYLRYNGSKSMLKMVLIDLRAPVGFAFVTYDFSMLLDLGIINQYEINGRQAVVYIDNLRRGEPIEFSYNLRATMPIRGTIQDICAWDMYNPELRTELPPVEFVAY